MGRFVSSVVFLFGDEGSGTSPIFSTVIVNNAMYGAAAVLFVFRWGCRFLCFFSSGVAVFY